jgi:hypothetical protein
MSKYEFVEPVEDIRQVIKDVFDVDLHISGGWGYDNKTAVVAKDLNMPLDQFVHMFATIRATIEMNLMIKDENERMGGINVAHEDSKRFEIENKEYDVLTFKVTAMNEKKYAEFIQEYKDNYGKKDFDLNDHFKRREAATSLRVLDYWFYGLKED